MKENYRRLCAQHRKVIYELNKDGICQAEIGRVIGYSQSTVSKELSRNKGLKGYRFKQADELARERQKQKKTRSKVVIDEVKAQVEARRRYGDWEADLIQGGGGSGFLLSVYERKSRFGKLYKLENKESKEVAIAIIMSLQGWDVKTITYDNGLEFAKHEFVNDLLGSESYFCKPYSSWEKGGVENYNGLVRQYFPKGSDFNEITPERLQEVEDEINNRPRNVLGYEAPHDHLDHLQVS